MLEWGKLTGPGSVFALWATTPKRLFLRRTLTGAAVGICAFMGTAAAAADLGGRGSITDAPVPSAPRWAGFYVGGQIGLGRAFYDGVFDNVEADGGSVFEQLFVSDLDLSGAVGGIHVGYNWQSGNRVFGIEGDFNWTDLQDKKTAPDGENFITGNVEWLATVRGRLGIATDRTLFYATAGIAFAEAEYTAGENGAVTPPGRLSFDKVGVVVGGGAEHALTDRISLRVQGLYYVFNDRKDTSALEPVESNPGDFAKIENAYTITVGASYKF